MRKLAFLFALCMLLTLCAGCIRMPPAAPEDTTEPADPAETTEPADPVETTEPADDGPQPAALVGSWQRTHTEVEGDRNENTKATLTITGGDMTVTYQDAEFPNGNFTEKALTVKEGELYYGCENSSWFAEVAPTGKEAYCLTLLDDDTLLLQCYFEVDGYPMVSYQWFARIQ